MRHHLAQKTGVLDEVFEHAGSVLRLVKLLF